MTSEDLEKNRIDRLIEVHRWIGKAQHYIQCTLHGDNGDFIKKLGKELLEERQ